MTYASRNRSVQDSSPYELYKFVGPMGTFCYASRAEPVTIGDDVYEPLPITRTPVDVGSVVNGIRTCDINLPITCELAKLYGFLLTPDSLTVEVRRADRNEDAATEYQIEWRGRWMSSSVSDAWLTIRTGSIIQERLSGEMSAVLYQGTCNHTLYDELCKADPDDHSSTSIVIKVQGQLITVSDDGFADGDLAGGQLEVTRTGERRTILSNNSNVLRVGSRFTSIIEGDDVLMVQGCDHARLGHCKTRFDNVANYGGFDFTPAENPFQSIETIETIVTETRRQEVNKPFMPPSMVG